MDEGLEEGMSQFLSWLGEPNVLLSFINEIIQNEKYCDRCCCLSEIHRLGFQKLCIMSSENYQLRLHVWTPGSYCVGKEAIHNHKFNFCSKIIKGTIVNNIYDRCEKHEDGAVSMHEYLANPVGTRQYDSFIYRSVSNIRITSSSSYNPGDMYYMFHENYHDAFPGNVNELTATLFLRTKNIKSADTIFEREPFSTSNNENDIVPNRTLTTDEYREHLSKFASLLS